VQDVGVVTGPAIGAAILAVGSPAEAFAFNTLSFLFGGVTFAAIRQRSRGLGESAPSALVQFVDGMRAVRHTPYVPVLTFLTFVGAFTYGAQTVQLVVYVQQQLHLSPDGYGYLLGASGLGGVLGATVSNRMASRRRIAIPLIVASVAFVASQLLYAGVSVESLAIGISVMAGFGMVIADVIAETAISRTASNEVMGRIFGAYDGISVGAMVLGALAAAPLVRIFGVRASMVQLGVVAVAATLLCLPVLQGLDRLSAKVVAELSPRIDVLTKLAIFNGAPRVAIERLASSATELTVAPGTAVVTEGDLADAFYVCTAGQLDVSAAGERGGQARHLRTLGAGSYFGEIGLLEHIPRTASVQARTECSLLRIDGDVFLDALTAAPAGLSTMRDGVVRALARTHPSLRPEGTERLIHTIPQSEEGMGEGLGLGEGLGEGMDKGMDKGKDKVAP
jgi:CRP-like cAMP-binding protein